MPDIGALLKSEITRLSRKEAKSESDILRRASAQYRRDIAALKRQVADLQKVVNRLGGAVAKAAPKLAAPAADSGTPTRFVPKGLTSMRKRLGLSQAELAHLLGVSGQSVYQWERGTTRPRAEPLRKIVALRSVTKAVKSKRT